MRIPHARTASISGLALAAALAVSGCATSQDELLPTNGTTMAGIWQRATIGSGVTRRAGDSDGDHTTDLQHARSALRRPVAPANLIAERSAYTRTAANEIHSQFSRLPNPDLTLYIFPHLSGGTSEQVPIPGYTTIFPLYDRPHYGQPGERTAYQPVTDPGSAAR
ncbi:TIGR03751 family conjugal transfer lipoprotein [Salinisphaera japonica]|uniref:Conjugal transfer protein n=1 Tax=Salinisphaera japonica YTM-1 TaxID=1209778 RepID=A0A423PEV4_9GAMM|nr:TIGR03751 family conjugal transfer lipoprotein [Salinisphaera japonica]ROO24117.1 conjugal transfer protein [Salinisphaera japonica YTM-1]